jgi:hypothetical protein
MSLILNVRGGSGSGKSTLVRAIMDHFGGVNEIYSGPNAEHVGYDLQHGSLYVVGRYNTPCGGCDALSGFEQIVKEVNALAAHGDVVFEGLLWSTVYRSSDEFARSIPHHTIFGLMDTSLELCYQRVLARRHAAGNDKPFPVEKLLTKYRSCWSSQERLRQAGHDTRPIPHERGLETVLGWLSERQGAKWTTTAPASSRS